MKTKSIKTVFTNPNHFNNKDKLNSTSDRRKIKSCKNVNWNTALTPINFPHAQTCFVTEEILLRIYKNSPVIRKFKWLPKQNKLRHEVRSMLLESLECFRSLIVKTVSTYTYTYYK